MGRVPTSYGEKVDTDKWMGKAHKPIYGLKVSAAALYEYLGKKLRAIGFVKSEHDGALWMRRRKGQLDLLGHWVDDCVCLSTAPDGGKRIIRELQDAGLLIKDEGEGDRFIGVRMAKDKTTGIVTMDTLRYEQKLINKYDHDSKLRERYLPADPSLTAKVLEEAATLRGRATETETRAATAVEDPIFE